MSVPLRVALIGCGQIADAHLQEIRRAGNTELVGVCDAEYDLAYQAAVRFGVPAFTTDLDDLLERVRPDVLHITTPPHTHAAIGGQALRNGCHIYVEKPFTATAREAAQLITVAQSAGRLVCVGLDQLWEPVWQQVRSLAKDGTLGEVVHIDSYQGYALDGPYGRLLKRNSRHWVHQLPGGIFHNVAPHALGKITDLLPGAPDAVTALAYDRTDSGFATELRATMQWGGRTANLVFCSAAHPIQRVTRIVGTRAILEVDFDARAIRPVAHASWPGAFGRIQLSLQHWRSATRELRGVMRQFRRKEIQYFGGMRALFNAFYAAINRTGPLPFSAERIIDDMSVMERIFDEALLTRPAKPMLAEAR
jgi:predicted dehydrogenase